MSAKDKKNPLLTLALIAAAAIATAIALSACGGGSSATAADPHGNISKDEGVTQIATATFPGGHDTDEVSVTGAKPIKPCALVPKKKAEKILGANVQVSERPQGPTCVYMGSGREIDLVVAKVRLSSLKETARTTESVTIDGRQGLCLKSGSSSSVVIGIRGGKVLQVTGPCQAGVRFAAIALTNI